jgi:hypothetical protein
MKWGRWVSGLPRSLGGSYWQYLRLAYLHFVNYYVQSFIILFWEQYIFLLVCNNYTLVILACKLYVPCVTQILSYVWLFSYTLYIYFEVFQLEALICYLISSLLDIYTFRYQFITLKCHVKIEKFSLTFFVKAGRYMVCVCCEKKQKQISLPSLEAIQNRPPFLL